MTQTNTHTHTHTHTHTNMYVHVRTAYMNVVPLDRMILRCCMSQSRGSPECHRLGVHLRNPDD